MMTRFKTIHPFPARMAPEVAWDELEACSTPSRVLDPMSGSGTSLVAARLRGHEAIGIDRDPLAVLIAHTWVSDVDSDAANKKAREVLAKSQEREHLFKGKFAFPVGADDETKDFVKYWFDCRNRSQLASLADTISRVRDLRTRDVLWCALSRLIITKKSGVSLAMDVSHSRPHKKYEKALKTPFATFLKSVAHIASASPFKPGNGITPATVLSSDARNMPIHAESIDLIITSPPYLNAIDYLRGHKLSLVWMGHSIAAIRNLRANNVGSEVAMKSDCAEPLANSVIKDMCSGAHLTERQEGMLRRYVVDLHALLKECFRVLKREAKGTFVLGNCNLGSTFVSNSVALELLGASVGFKIEGSRRRPLPDNRRYLPPPKALQSGAALGKRMREEVILTMRKQ